MKSGADLPAQLAEYLASKYHITMGAILAGTIEKEYAADYYVLEILGHGKTALSYSMLAGHPQHPTAGEKYGVPSGPAKVYGPNDGDYYDKQMHKAMTWSEWKAAGLTAEPAQPSVQDYIDVKVKEQIKAAKAAEYAKLYGGPPTVKAPKPLSGVMDAVFADYKAQMMAQIHDPSWIDWLCKPKQPKYNPPVKPAKQGQQIQLDI